MTDLSLGFEVRWRQVTISIFIIRTAARVFAMILLRRPHAFPGLHFLHWLRGIASQGFPKHLRAIHVVDGRQAVLLKLVLHEAKALGLVFGKICFVYYVARLGTVLKGAKTTKKYTHIFYPLVFAHFEFLQME